MEEAESIAAENMPENNEKRVVAKSTWSEFVAETKRISLIFLPMVLVTTSQYLLRFVSTLMVGHVGKLYLSGAVVAMSFTNVTGFSFLVSLILCSCGIHLVCVNYIHVIVYRELDK